MNTNKIESSNQSWLSNFIGLCQQTAHILWPLALGYGAIYLFLRVAFTVYHFDQLQGISASGWLSLYLNGLRFDLAALSPFLLLFFLVSIISAPQIRRFFWWIVGASALLFILLNGADVVLSGFTGRRFSKSSLVLVGEGSWKNLLDYTVMASFTGLFLVIGFLISKISLIRLEERAHQKNFFGRLILSALALIVFVVMARGGLQLKPISHVDAKVIDHQLAHQVVLNSTFTFLSSFGKKNLQKKTYFSQEEMLSYLNLNPEFSKKTEIHFDFTNTNVVFFILEGFSAEYFNKKNTPFLQSLSEMPQAAFFDQAYANGRRSIEGIAALFAGIPALMEDPFINSEYANNQFIGLGELFKRKRYHTSFFHGAINGSMRFDQFTRAVGFDHYFGKNEFPDQTKDDGTWGISDGPFLKWSCEQQSLFPVPFLSSVFTLSSHHPYTVPDDFKKTHPAETPVDRIERSFQYTDWAVQKYFECAKTKPWFEKTLFVFVGDHTGPSLIKNPTMTDLYHITLGFYHSSLELKNLLPTNQFAQQIDLLPTLIDLFKLGPIPPNHLSRSLLNTGKKSIALYSDHRWEIVGDVPDLEKSLKATQQYFSEAMIDNRLYAPPVR